MIVSYASQNYTINIPFTDKASIDNAVLCILTLLSLGKDFSYINEGIKQLTAVDMRMQLKKGINGCTFINDSYNLDFDSFVAAGFYLQAQAAERASNIIVSDFAETGESNRDIYSKVAKHAAALGLKRFIGIGPQITKHQSVIEKSF